MKTATIKNFHLPLSPAQQAQLRRTAEREGVPATVIARRALEEWLKAREREERAREIAAYAAAAAGGPEDLDPALESASIANWLEEERSPRDPR
jgi:hypothetical protein